MKHSIPLALVATLALALPVTAQVATESADPATESPAAGAPDSDTSGIAFPVMLGGQLEDEVQAIETQLAAIQQQLKSLRSRLRTTD